MKMPADTPIAPPERGTAATTEKLRQAYDRLKRVTEGNVGFPECVEAERDFVLTAFEIVPVLLAHSAAAQGSADLRIPEGFVLVPREPTAYMLDKAADVRPYKATDSIGRPIVGETTARECWEVFIAAAPARLADQGHGAGVEGDVEILRQEVAYWRRDAAARLWTARNLLGAHIRHGDDEKAFIRRDTLRATIASVEEVRAREWGDGDEITNDLDGQVEAARAVLNAEDVAPDPAPAPAPAPQGGDLRAAAPPRGNERDPHGLVRPDWHGKSDLFGKQFWNAVECRWQPTVPEPLAAPSEPAEMAGLRRPDDGWQPIETAPSEGEPVWVWGGAVQVPQRRQADGEWWRLQRDRGSQTVVTHWISDPLPPPPAEIARLTAKGATS